MEENHIIFFTIFLIGILFPACIVFFSRVATRHIAKATKYPPNFQGERFKESLAIPFHHQFYVNLFVFLVFEVLLIFLVLCVITLKESGIYSLIGVFVFLGFLLLGLFYLWGSGDMQKE